MHLSFLAILIILCSIAAYYLIRSLLWSLPTKWWIKCLLALPIFALCSGFPLVQAYGRDIDSTTVATCLLCSGALVCYLVSLAALRDIVLLPLAWRKKPHRGLRNVSSAAVVILAIIFMLIGYHRAYDTQVIEIDVPISSSNKALAGLRIVQITDTHVTKHTPKAWLEKIVAMTNALQPDIICITGDIADLELPDTEGHMNPLSQLRARYGVYFVDGNHEYYKGQIFGWRQLAPELGFTLLNNDHRTIEHEGARIQIAGIPDSISGKFGAGKANVAKALSSEEDYDFRILLSHRSQAVYDAPEHPLDLVLAGHTHGGQFFPWNIIVALAQPHLKGLYQEGSRNVYVNQGTGFWAIPNRFGTTSEISLFHLIPQS